MGIIDHNSPLNILISVKGHPYERDPFAAVFESFEGIRHTFVEQPASQAFLNPEAAEPWDVLVFYDMPGIDFSTQPPGLIPPPENLKAGFNEHTKLDTIMGVSEILCRISRTFQLRYLYTENPKVSRGESCAAE